MREERNNYAILKVKEALKDVKQTKLDMLALKAGVLEFQEQSILLMEELEINNFAIDYLNKKYTIKANNKVLFVKSEDVELAILEFWELLDPDILESIAEKLRNLAGEYILSLKKWR